MAVTDYQYNIDRFHHKTKTAHALQLPQAVPLTLQSVWSIRVAALTHFARDVKQFCDCHYPEAWIGRNGLVLWPLRSPDLTPVGPSRGTVYWQTVNRRNDFGV
jgi:hypothetical protein